MARKRINFSDRDELIADDPLRDCFVSWDGIMQVDADELERAVEAATGEAAMQAYLEAHPVHLIQHLGGGHGRWMIPHQRLGAEHVTDFMIADKHSGGFEWTAVELESPKALMFTKAGDPSAALSHAIRQIMDWRSWLMVNQNYAARSRPSGLGLTDVDPRLRGLIIIGREGDVDTETNERRRQYAGDLLIEIHTYDWLVRNARGSAEAAESRRGKRRKLSG